jgi:hypothetical protein
MRATFLTFALFAVIACGNGGGAGPGGDAHAGSDAHASGDVPDSGEMPAFDITSSDIMLSPSQQVTYCYYFKTPNTSSLAIHKWVSDMTPGSHHMIFFAGGPSHADGLDTSGNCGFSGGGGGSVPAWTFSSQTPHYELDLPSDDGGGKPLAQIIPPNTQGVFQMHYLNASDATLTAHVELKAYALPASAAYTQTDAYLTYNQDLAIPPHANAMASPPTSGSIWTGSCSVPAGAKFWMGSSHTHKQGVEVDVMDGTNSVYKTMDWEHPTVQMWNAPFYTFSTGQVTWTCKYVNLGDNANITLHAANDALHAEMCMMAGYYFPSSGPKFNVQYGGHCYPF